jgi:hypothetical protein
MLASVLCCVSILHNTCTPFLSASTLVDALMHCPQQLFKWLSLLQSCDCGVMVTVARVEVTPLMMISPRANRASI